MMGECCRKGTGVEKSANKAAEWYEKAAEQEYAPAQYRLGCCYEDKDGKTYDAFKAAELFRKAAEKDEKRRTVPLWPVLRNGKRSSAGFEGGRKMVSEGSQ